LRVLICEKWSFEFAQFIKKITSNTYSPKVIEIHPPFSDYSYSISDFIKTYAVFEDAIKSKHPDTMILIKNRAGSDSVKTRSQFRGTPLLN
jgi:hypothetical protein